MIRDGRGDRNRKWEILFLSKDFMLGILGNGLPPQVLDKPPGKFLKTDMVYDTNPWDGTSSKEDVRHFLFWENEGPWEKSTRNNAPTPTD